MITDLAIQMIQVADRDNLPADHKLRTTAEEFDKVSVGYAAEPPTHNAKQLLGAWARARKAWCEYTGESLV